MPQNKQKPIYFVTGNKNKAREARSVLSLPLEIVDIDLPEIQSLDIYEVVMRKTADAFKLLKKPLIVEDVGAYIAAWNGFPGPLVKYLHEVGGKSHDLTLKMLENFDDKTIEIKAVIGYHDGKKIHIVEGSLKGTLVEKRGNRGWGFDAYVIPEGYDKTFAQLPEKLKNKISHRAQALMKFEEIFNKK